MSEHILIIEDDLDIANIERDYLMVAGYDVTIMTNGTDGIEAALNTPVDLIILDVMLPEMDGFEVCRQIRDKVRVPIVMVTARLDDIDKGLSRIAHLQSRNTDSPRNHEHLEHVKGNRRSYTGVGGFRGDLKP